MLCHTAMHGMRLSNLSSAMLNTVPILRPRLPCCRYPGIANSSLAKLLGQGYRIPAANIPLASPQLHSIMMQVLL